MRRHGTKLSQPDDLAPGICAPWGTTSLSRNVGNEILVDAVSHPRKTDTAARLKFCKNQLRNFFAQLRITVILVYML
jgi:hypothetical protein